MSAVANDVIVADKPILTLQPKHDDLEMSGRSTADGEVLDSATNGVEEVVIGAGDVPGATHKDDDSWITTTSDDTLATETSAEVLNVSKVVGDTEPETPLQHTSDPDNEKTIIIHDSEPPANAKIYSRPVEVSEQPTTFKMSPNKTFVTLAELTEEDANKGTDTAISEITKDELPATSDTEAHTPPVDADTTIADGPKASVKDGVYPVCNSVGPESAVSDNVKPSINGVGSTTGTEPSLETPTRDPNVQMAELQVATPLIEVQEIPPTSVEPVEDISELREGDARQTEVEVLPTDERPVVTEPVVFTVPAAEDTASEDTLIPVETELACIEAQSSPDEPETMSTRLEAVPIDSTASEELLEETVAVTEPEPEPILQPITEAANSDSAKEIAPVAEAIIAAAEPDSTSCGEPEEPIAVFVAPVAAEEMVIEEPKVAIMAVDQPIPPTEPEEDASVPEVVSAPAEVVTEPVVAPIQLEEASAIAIMEPEDSAETAVAAEAGSIAAEPAHVAFSNPEPVAVTNPDPNPVAIAEPEAATVVPESLATVEPEPTKPEVENMVGETVPIDVEPPSSNASFIEDPEVGFAYTNEESQSSVTEEAVAAVFDELALEFAEEESKPQEVVVFEEPPVDETVAVEEVVPVDLAASTREPASSDETAPVEESPVGGTVQVEEVVTPLTVEPAAVAGVAVTDVALVEDVAPVEDATPVEEITPSEGVTSIKSPAIEAVATSVEEDIPVVEEPSAPASAEENTPAIEEPPAPAPVEEDISVVEELSVPATVEEVSAIEEPPVPYSVEEHVPVIEELFVPTPVEDVVPDVEESPVPASVEEDVPDVEELPVTTSVEEISAIEELPVPTSVEDDVPVVEELPVFASVEEDIVVEEPPAPAPVEEDTPTVEEPLALAGVEEPEAVTIEDVPTPGEEHKPVAVEETPVQPVVIEEPAGECYVADEQKDEIPIVEATPAVDEPALEATPTTKEPPALEEGLATALHETSAVEVPPTPAAASVTTADSTLAASSVEETVIVAEELVECDAPVVEQSALIEEPAPAESESSVFEEVATEELHATVEPTEEPLVANEETNDGLEESPRAEAPATLTEQLADESTTEESPEVPIAEFLAETAVEPTVLEEEELVNTSQVQVDEEPVNADVIHPEVNESIEDSEPSSALAETSSEIEEVAEQQKLAAIVTLSVVTDIERPKSPWTPSYSVTTQGSSVAVEEPASTYEGEDDIVPTHAQTPEIIVDEAAVIVPEIVAGVAAAIQSKGDNVAVQSAEEQVALDKVEEARPKSPWASSYSVTVQGNVTQSQEGPDDLEQLPPSAAQSVEAEEVEQPVSFTQEALLTGEVSSSTEVVADAHAVLLETLEDIVEHTVPDPAIEAEVLQHVPSEQVTPAVEAESLALIMPEPATVEEEPEEEIDLGSFIVEDESMQLSTEPTRERSRSPWTPSYSVTGLEPAVASETQEVADEDEFVEQGSFIIENPATAVESTPEAKPELLTPVDDPVGEGPKSPWTPSYSVTKQGPSEETEELDELKQLPSPVASPPALAADEEPISPVLIAEIRASVDEYVTADEALTDQETLQTFPILEGSQKISKKPSLSAVDELSAANVIDVTESTTLRINIPAANEDSRKRLESTTSSRFFPGGWFSSSPKIPEEGRASLNVAAGEFVHQTSVENTPSTALPSAVEEDREKKSRWCTIM